MKPDDETNAALRFVPPCGAAAATLKLTGVEMVWFAGAPRICIKTYEISCLIAAACMPHESFSASFNCDFAKTATELAICSNDALSALDGELGEAYQEALKLDLEVRDRQIEWIKARNENCKSNVTCLTHEAESRLRELREIKTSEFGNHELGLDTSTHHGSAVAPPTRVAAVGDATRMQAPIIRAPDYRGTIDNALPEEVQRTEPVVQSPVIRSNHWFAIILVVCGAIAGTLASFLFGFARQRRKSRVQSSKRKLNLDERRQQYKDFLVNEGCAPSLDGQGDIMFEHDGNGYYMLFDPADEDFIRIVLPNIAPSVENEAQGLAMTVSAMEATSKAPVAKIMMVRDQFWACAEFYCDPPESFEYVFHRILGTLRTAARIFRDMLD